MKTTVHIPDSLLEKICKIASREQTNVDALIEEGLRLIIDDRKQKRTFRLRKATFKGSGLQSDVADASWDKIREISYSSHGE